MKHGDFGRYQIVKRLGIGGTADIYLAQEMAGEEYVRTIVLKVLRPELLDDPDFSLLLLEEAKIASCVKHPNIAQIHDFGETVGLKPYLAMEFVFGKDLHQIQDRARRTNTPIPHRHIVTIMADVLKALSYAHEEARLDGQALAIVHRDVSPQNILIGFDGCTKLLDFGLAKTRAQISRTRTGFLKGKYAYMAPEQLRFEEVDHRADLFSAGVVLWEGLTGRRLFLRPSDLQTVDAVLAERAPFPRALEPQIPWTASWVAFRALSKHKAWRYKSARTMHDALLRVQSRNQDEARAELAQWLAGLFAKELALREAALANLDQNSLRYRQVSAAGFSLIEDLKDTRLEQPRHPISGSPAASGAKGPHRPPPRGSLQFFKNLFLSSSWFLATLAGLVCIGLLAGVYIGSQQKLEIVSLGYLNVDAEHSGIRVEVNQYRVGETPLEQLKLPPGRYQIRAFKDNNSITKEIDIKAGQTEELRLEFPHNVP